MCSENMDKSVAEIIYPKHVLERFLREKIEEERLAELEEDEEEVF